MSSVFALKVTPKKVIFLLLTLFLRISYTLLSKIFDLFSFDLITDFITDKLILNLSAVEIIALVSFGKQEPPYAGPALRKRLPILLSNPIPIEISSTFIPVFSHKLAISFMNVIFVAKKALDAYFINSAPLRVVVKKLAPLFIKGWYNFFSVLKYLFC